MSLIGTWVVVDQSLAFAVLIDLGCRLGNDVVSPAASGLTEHDIVEPLPVRHRDQRCPEGAQRAIGIVCRIEILDR